MKTESNRRDFAKLTLLAPLLPMTAQAAEPELKPLDEADQLLALVQARYPNENLDEAALSKIKKSIASQLARANRLKEFGLHNHDTPASQFTALSSDD